MNTETELWMEKAEEAWDKKDYKMAAKWQYCLGMCYYGGLGVKLNEGAAFKWVRKAAEQNEPDAQKALGDMYLRGEGVKADEIEALEWYRKASYNGNGEAGRIVDQMIHALELMI